MSQRLLISVIEVCLKIYFLISLWRTCITFLSGRSSSRLTRIMHWQGLVSVHFLEVPYCQSSWVHFKLLHLFNIQVYQSETVQLRYSPFTLSAHQLKGMLNYWTLCLFWNCLLIHLKSLIQILKNKQAKELDSVMINYNGSQSQPKHLLNA